MKCAMRLSETMDPSSRTSGNTTTHTRAICRVGVGLHVPVVRLRIHVHFFRFSEFNSLVSLSILTTLSKLLDPVKGILKNILLFCFHNIQHNAKTEASSPPAVRK
jgi:hypothetical protein